MAPAKKKEAPKPGTGAAAPKTKKVKEIPKSIKKLLAHRRTRSLWSSIKKTAKRKNVAPETLIKKRPKSLVKPIGGEKNGGKRLVRVNKGKKYYPTEDKPKKRRTGHVTYKMHKRTLKKGNHQLQST